MHGTGQGANRWGKVKGLTESTRTDWSIAFCRRFDVFLLPFAFQSFCFPCDDLILTSREKGQFLLKPKIILYTCINWQNHSISGKDVRQHAVPICRWLHHKAAGHWLRQFEVHSAWLHLSLVAKLQVIDSPQAESLAKQARAVVVWLFFDVSFVFLHIRKQVDPQDPPPAGGCWGAWHHQVE